MISLFMILAGPMILSVLLVSVLIRKTFDLLELVSVLYESFYMSMENSYDENLCSPL